MQRTIGYVPGLTIRGEQMLNLQLHVLCKAGCEVILSDQVSGRESEPPGWSKLLAELKPGDTVVVWKLDYLGPLTTLLGSLSEKGVILRSLIGDFDSRTRIGEALCALARAIRSSRCASGRAPGTQQ